MELYAGSSRNLNSTRIFSIALAIRGIAASRILRGHRANASALIQWPEIRLGRIWNWLLIVLRILWFSEESNDLILNPDMPSANVDQIFKRRSSHVRARVSVRASFEVSEDLSWPPARAAFSQWFVQSCTAVRMWRWTINPFCAEAEATREVKVNEKLNGNSWQVLA